WCAEPYHALRRLAVVRNLFYFVVHVYLCGILVHSVSSTVRSYLRTQPVAAGSGFLAALQDATGKACSWPVVNLIADYSGIAMGYGFFAPQVASSYRLQV